MLETVLYKFEGPGTQGKEPGGCEGTSGRGPSVHGMQRSWGDILWQSMLNFLSREKTLQSFI